MTDEISREFAELGGEEAVYRRAQEIPGVREEMMKVGHKVLLVNFTTNRLLAVLRPDGQNWAVSEKTISSREINAVLSWIGRIREHLEKNAHRETVIMPILEDWSPAEKRFFEIGGFLGEKP